MKMKAATIVLALFLQSLLHGYDDFEQLAASSRHFTAALESISESKLKLIKTEEITAEQRTLLGKAKKELEKCLEIDPLHAGARYYYGRILFAEGEFHKALSVFERTRMAKVVDDRTHEYWLSFYTVKCLYESGDHEGARVEIEIYNRIPKPSYTDRSLTRFPEIQAISSELPSPLSWLRKNQSFGG